MEYLRCPTCLSLLADGGAKRCPSCRTRLGSRGRPIVLGESNRISSRPVMAIEWDLRAKVLAENEALERRERVAAKAGAGNGSAPPASFGGVAPEVAAGRHSSTAPKGREARKAARSVRHPAPPTSPALFESDEVEAAPERARHVPRRRRRVAPKPKPQIDTAPAPSLFDADATAAVVEPEVVEAVVVEPEVVVPEVVDVAEPIAEPIVEPAPKAPRRKRKRAPSTHRVEAPEPEAREVVIPEVLFDDEPAAESDRRPDPTPDMIDLTTEPEAGSTQTDAEPRLPPPRPHLFSGTASSPRVKKIRAKGKKGWVVDYVIPESEPKDAGT